MNLVAASFNKKYENDIEDSIEYVGGTIPDQQRQLQYLDNIIRNQLTVGEGGIQELNSTLVGDASGASDEAVSRNDYIQTVKGYTIEERAGKLSQDLSAVRSARADKAGAANKAYLDAKDYVDNQLEGVIQEVNDYTDEQIEGTARELKDYTDEQAEGAVQESKDYTDACIEDALEGLGSIMSLQGTLGTVEAIQVLTNVKKGWVYVCSADDSEWVALENIGDIADPSKWECLGTAGISDALTKGDNVFTDGAFLVADGVNGKVKAISDSTIATRLNYKTKQTPYEHPATSNKYISGISQNANGEVEVTTDNLPTIPSGSGSVGTESSDANAWKTVVHDAALSSGHALSGHTKSIPAATTTSDGYMTKEQVASLAGKQDTLQSGSNIKTINNQSVLGSGNINIPVINSETVRSIIVLTESEYDALSQTDPNTLYIITPDD